MITLWQAVLIALVAVLTELDGNIFGENKMREPIVTGFLVGVILGDVSKGLMLGAQMQLMWMGATAIGPTAGLDIGTGGTVGAAVAISTGTGLESAIMFGVPVSVIMQFVNTLIMAAFSAVMLEADKAIERLKLGRLAALHWMCVLNSAIKTFALIFMLMYLGGDLIDGIVNGLPAWASSGLNGIAALLPCLGFALLMNIIMDGSLWAYFIIGFVPAAFVGFDINMVGMAAIAVAIALIIWQLRTSQAVSSPQAAVASDDEWED